MITAVLLVAAKLIVLQTLDGYEVSVAADQITYLGAAKDGTSNRLLTEAARCIVNLTDGRFITVTETCSSVRQRLEAIQ